MNGKQGHENLAQVAAMRIYTNVRRTDNHVNLVREFSRLLEAFFD